MGELFTECKARVNIVDVVSRYWRVPGKNLFVTCPFHGEKTPSLRVFKNNGTWHCFGCGKGGSVIDFVRELFDVDALGAVRRLNDDFHLGLVVDNARDITPAERAKIAERAQAAEERAKVKSWRESTLKAVCAALRVVRQVLEDHAGDNNFTDQEAGAVRWGAALGFWREVLALGTDSEVTELYRDRQRIGARVQAVLGDGAQIDDLWGDVYGQEA